MLDGPCSLPKVACAFCGAALYMETEKTSDKVICVVSLTAMGAVGGAYIGFNFAAVGSGPGAGVGAALGLTIGIIKLVKDDLERRKSKQSV